MVTNFESKHEKNILRLIEELIPFLKETILQAQDSDDIEKEAYIQKQLDILCKYKSLLMLGLCNANILDEIHWFVQNIDNHDPEIFSFLTYT